MFGAILFFALVFILLGIGAHFAGDDIPRVDEIDGFRYHRMP